MPLIVYLGVVLAAATVGPLPQPVTNNAVAAVEHGGGRYFYSFNGLGAAKTIAAITARAFEYNTATGVARRLADVPGGMGRLAGTAVTLGAKVYLFGGYAVAPDGAETSTPEVFAFEPQTGAYTPRAAMPTPVDDAVALAYLDRYAILVSGWHDHGNVALVQVFDSTENRWFRATDYPGSPVFGHAGGIVGNRLVIADGVKVLDGIKGAARFAISDEAYLGDIDVDDPSRISWHRLPPHPGAALYRAAAAGLADRHMVLFAGGSANPYNYNGLGYDDTPSAPSAAVFGYDLEAGKWRRFKDKPRATMDHRGLLQNGAQLCTLGGMAAGRTVIGDVQCWELDAAE